MTPNEPNYNKRRSFSLSSMHEDGANKTNALAEASASTADAHVTANTADANGTFEEVQNNYYDENYHTVIMTENPQEKNIKTKKSRPSANNAGNEGLLGVTSKRIINSIPYIEKNQNRNAIKQGEEEMAEVDTTQLSSEHGAIRYDIATEAGRLGTQIGSEICGVNKHIGDVRFESAENFGHTRADIHKSTADIRQENARNFADGRYASATETADIRREVAEVGYEGVSATKDVGYNVLREVDRTGDRLDNQATQFYIAAQTNANVAARDIATLGAMTEANAVAMRNEIALNVEKSSAAAALAAEKIGAASALSAEKIATAVALGQANLERNLLADGQKTRDLLNDHKYHDLNRALVERQNELVCCNQEKGRYHDNWWDSRFGQYSSQNAAQFAAMQSQLQSMNQNFNSQLSETRQGMVNFGTMAGVGQTSSANNVR